MGEVRIWGKNWKSKTLKLTNTREGEKGEKRVFIIIGVAALLVTRYSLGVKIGVKIEVN